MLTRDSGFWTRGRAFIAGAVDGRVDEEASIVFFCQEKPTKRKQQKDVLAADSAAKMGIAERLETHVRCR
jgi:hypothetical protein